mgnify:CR=1 FL=1
MVVGFVLLIAFGLYEAYGRTDGIVAHVFCESCFSDAFASSDLTPYPTVKHNNNFALSVGAFAIEGWIFYSAVNSVVPQVRLPSYYSAPTPWLTPHAQIVLNLGFATDAWVISKRQLLYSVYVPNTRILLS